MASLKQIERHLADHPESCFVVHDGYAGWSYGSPFNPTVVTPEAAVYLLNHALASESVGAGFDATDGAFPAVQYAEVGDELYTRSGRNRFVQCAPLAECLMDPGHSVGPPSDLGLSGPPPGVTPS